MSKNFYLEKVKILKKNCKIFMYLMIDKEFERWF